MANEAFKLNYNINFQLEKRRLNGELIVLNVPIQMIITFNSQRLKLLVGYKIDANKWDEKNQRVKKGASNVKKEMWSDINNHLAKLETTIVNAFDTFKLRRITPSLDEIKTIFRESQGKTDGQQKNPFFDVFENFITEQSKENTWSASTIIKHKTVYNTLKEFDSKLTFETFGAAEIQSYLEFLRVKKGYRNTTIAKQLKNVKWFLRWALRKKYSTNSEFIDFRPKLIGVTESHENIIFLTLDECKKLFIFDAKKDYLNRVKDVFLFCCFTGLRFSDVFKLKRSDVKDGYISVTTLKTTDKLTIQLNQYSSAILQKYSEIPFDEDKALPVISNQKMNKYLKELCRDAGLNEPQRIVYFKGSKRIEEVKPKYELIATHTARRSFISNAIALGMPVEILIKFTGHRDYNSMSPYLKVLEDTKSSEMARFNV